MSFSQNSSIADLGKIRGDAADVIRLHARHRPVTLFLPATLEDALSDTMQKKIIPVLEEIDYVDVVLGLDTCQTREDFDTVKGSLEDVANSVVIWNDAPEMREVLDGIKKDIPPGKGRNLWIGLGYNFTVNPVNSIILHDCDIETYVDDTIVRSLALPLVDPQLGHSFVKAYYNRLTKAADGQKKMAGRVTRLLVAPLIEALAQLYGGNDRARDYFNHLRGYNYILAGEFGMSHKLAATMTIQPDWGLEIGMAGYMFWHEGKMGQVDLGEYDHRHSKLEADNKEKGLNKMAREIVKTMLRELFNMSVTSLKGEDNNRAEEIVGLYLGSAHRLIGLYADRARHVGLAYDVAEETAAVTMFAEQCIPDAFETFSRNPHIIKPLPAVRTFDSNILERMKDITWMYNPEKC